MAKALKTPVFETEEEEALWWEGNQDLLLKEFEAAAEEGTLGRGILSRRDGAPAITIRLDPNDIQMARVQAEERGLGYQTYLEMVIHQALMQEAASKMTLGESKV